MPGKRVPTEPHQRIDAVALGDPTGALISLYLEGPYIAYDLDECQ
jgi:hypothetical protein